MPPSAHPKIGTKPRITRRYDRDAVLATCTDLERVSLYMAKAQSLEFLRSTPKVRSLDLYGFEHTFPDYEPVVTLPALEELNVYMNRQATDEKLAVLEKLTRLTTFRMANCRQVTSVSFLRNCKSLEVLRATWAKQLADVSALANMPNLRLVDIRDSKIDDLTPFKGLAKLREIIISGTPVTDLSPLAECPGLEAIMLDETQVTDLSPLLELANLGRITLSPTVPQEQIDKLKEARPKIRISVRD